MNLNEYQIMIPTTPADRDKEDYKLSAFNANESFLGVSMECLREDLMDQRSVMVMCTCACCGNNTSSPKQEAWPH